MDMNVAKYEMNLIYLVAIAFGLWIYETNKGKTDNWHFLMEVKW